MPKYTEKDFVDVVDENDNAQDNQIPKRWLGTEFGQNLKKAGKAAKKADDAPPPPPEIPEGEPNDDWSHAQLDAFASDRGVDVSAAKNKEEKLALLAAGPKTEEVTGQ